METSCIGIRVFGILSCPVEGTSAETPTLNLVAPYAWVDGLEIIF